MDGKKKLFLAIIFAAVSFLLLSGWHPFPSAAKKRADATIGNPTGEIDSEGRRRLTSQQYEVMAKENSNMGAWPGGTPCDSTLNDCYIKDGCDCTGAIDKLHPKSCFCRVTGTEPQIRGGDLCYSGQDGMCKSGDCTCKGFPFFSGDDKGLYYGNSCFCNLKDDTWNPDTDIPLIDENQVCESGIDGTCKTGHCWCPGVFQGGSVANNYGPDCRCKPSDFGGLSGVTGVLSDGAQAVGNVASDGVELVENAASDGAQTVENAASDGAQAVENAASDGAHAVADGANEVIGWAGGLIR
jgi:hypothetical protein